MIHFNLMVEKKLLKHYKFPSGVRSIFINGKNYSRDEFLKAQSKEKLRDSKGRYCKLRYIDFYNSIGEKGAPMFEYQLFN